MADDPASLRADISRLQITVFDLGMALFELSEICARSTGNLQDRTPHLHALRETKNPTPSTPQ